MKNKRNCPFKKRIKINRPQGIYQDNFAWCDEERCMAFKNNKCLRLEPINKEGVNDEKHEYKEQN